MNIFKQKWFIVLTVGLALFLVSLWMTSLYEIIYPVTIIIGSFLVPVAFVTYIGEYERGVDREKHIIPARVTAWCFLTGGALGVTGAALLEFATLATLGIPQMFAVGLIEESIKMIIPLVFFFAGRYRSQADGLLFGIAAGMGFAALETIGYGFYVFFESMGDTGSLAYVLVVRGLFSPANQAAWTGMICAILWHERIKAGYAVLNLPVIGIFILAIMLHAFWNIFSGLDSLAIVLLGYLGIAFISVYIISRELRTARGV